MPVSGVADLAGRVLAGRYRLLVPIGAGASGRVYAADDVRLRRRVAVKVLHTALADDAGFLRRFRSEAQLAASLHHPNVMTVHDWGEDGVPFMVLELLEGGSLRGLLDGGRALTAAQAAHVGRQVASALEYAHARGLVHRDIKPANLLFDEHGIVRVADFGLARALAEASWTEPAGAVVGTARYAAPEQATGAALDGRSDLYALALVLVEAVTGRVPFAADTPIGTLAARTQRPISAPAELGPLGAVVERAGRPDPADRYPDAATMGRALADVEDMLPLAGPLPLAGLDETIEDPNPTQLPRTRALVFDQDAADIDVVDEPIVIETSARRDPAGRRWIGSVVAAVLVLALLGVAFFLIGNVGASAAVPNIVGATQTQASDLAQRAGLTIAVAQRAADDPKGVVIGQHPAAGSWMGDGSTIHVVVSTGPKPVPFPNLAGKTAAAAQQALQQLGFVVQIEARHDETVLGGVVLGTEPKGAAPRDSVVKLVVSDGPAPVAVPSVASGTCDQATAALRAVHLVASCSPQFSDTVPVGQVIGTNPPAGQPVPRDSAVAVLVSKGPDLVTVPKVFPLPLDQASRQLAALGLQVQVQGAYTPGVRVRAQDPQPGAQIKRGSTVTLFL